MSEGIDLIRKQIRERQTERILCMHPGRELDALIAQYVMELQVEERRSEPDEPIDYWYRLNSSIHVEEEEIDRVPNYSTVLFSAEKVLTKFQYWKLESSPEHNGIVAQLSNKSHEMTLHTVAVHSIPEAICKAALIAIVEQNRIIDQLMVDS